VSILQNEVRSTLVKYIAIATNMVGGVLLSMILVKFLSKEDYGTYSFIFSTVATITIITSFGLNATVIRFIPDYIINKRYLSINTLIKFSITLKVISSIFIIILLYTFSDYFISFFNQALFDKELLKIFLVFIFFYTLNPLLATIFFSSYSLEYKNSYTEIFKSLFLLISISYFLFLGYGIKTIIVLWIISLIIIFLYIVKNAVPVILYNQQNGLNEKFEIKRVFQYAKYNFLTVSTGFLRDTSIDIFVISHYLGSEKVAFYALGVSIALYLSKINPSEVLKNVFYPLIFKEYAQKKDINVLKRYSMFLAKISAFTVLPVLLVILIYAKEIIIYIFNPQYTESIIVLQIMALFYTFRIFTKSLVIFFLSLEKNKIIFIGSLFGIINFILSIILIKILGIKGVALSTGITWLLNFLFYYLMIRVKIKCKLFAFNIYTFKFFINIIIFTLSLLLFKFFITNIFTLLGFSFLAYLIFLFISTKNKIFTTDEKSFINSLFNKKVWIF